MAKNYWDLKYFDKDTLAFVDTIAQVENIADAPFIFNRNFEINSEGYMLLPAGPTGDRPGNVAGRIRHNTTTNEPEFNNGTEWLSMLSAGGGGSDAETLAFRTTDLSRDTGPALLADTDLQIAVLANTIYYFEIRLYVVNVDSSTANIRYNISGPTGSEFLYRRNMDGVASLSSTSDNTNNVFNSVNTTGISASVGFGRLDVGGTAGNITVNWAQNSARAGQPTTVKAGSFIRLY